MRIRVIVVIASLLIACASDAQIQRSFVSSTGNDANPCTLAAPCRNFAAAVAVLLSGGEVVVLDSAGYGPVTLTQSVSIIAPPGVYAGVTAFSGDAITVNAPASSVVLRGLTLNAQGGSAGVYVVASGSLRIEGCSIFGFTGYAIVSNGAGPLTVNDTVARENAGGVVLNGTTAVIDGCRFESNEVGVFATTGSKVLVRETVVAGPGFVNGFAHGTGVRTDGTSAADIVGCVITANHLHPGVVNFGTVTVASSTITDNGIGLDNSAGTLISYGNNEVCANATDTGGTITHVAAQ